MADKEQATAADDALSQAAAEAIESQKDVEDKQEQQEEQPEQVEQEAAEAEETTAEEQQAQPEQLPQDHTERSNLGRKLSAYHRRMDEFESRQREQQEGFARLADLLENKLLVREENSQNEVPPQYLAGLDPEEPITAKEAIRLAQSIAAKMADERYQQNKQTEQKQTREYRDAYDRTVLNLASSLTPDEQEGIFTEMTQMQYDPTDDPYRDGELNFRKAEIAYLRRKAAQATRTVPTKGEKPPGTVTAQKTVPKKEKEIKLDAWAEKYLQFAERESGADHAKKLLKE